MSIINMNMIKNLMWDSMERALEKFLEMKNRTFCVPTFKLSQVNKRLDKDNKPINEIISEKEAVSANMSSTMKSALDAFGDNDIIFVCFRQKIENDYLYAMACSQINHPNKEYDILHISVPDMEFNTSIIISGKESITVEKK